MQQNRYRTALHKRIMACPASVRQIAFESGMHPQTIYNYLLGKSDMLTGNLDAIHDVLDDAEQTTILGDLVRAKEIKAT